MVRTGDSQQTKTALQAQAIAGLNLKLDDLSLVVKEGFKGVHERQDTTNGKVLRAGADILENKSQLEKQIADLRGEFRYNKIIWYLLTVTMSVIIALASYILFNR